MRPQESPHMFYYTMSIQHQKNSYTFDVKINKTLYFFALHTTCPQSADCFGCILPKPMQINLYRTIGTFRVGRHRPLTLTVWCVSEASRRFRMSTFLLAASGRRRVTKRSRYSISIISSWRQIRGLKWLRKRKLGTSWSTFREISNKTL